MGKLETRVKERISQLRDEHGLTHRDLADKLKLKSVASYYVIEQGNARITVDHLEKIAKTYNISPSELLGEEHFAEDAHEAIPTELVPVFEEVMKDPAKLTDLLKLYDRLRNKPNDLADTLGALLRI